MTIHYKVQALVSIMNHYTPAQDYYFINRLASLTHEDTLLCPAQIDKINKLYEKYYDETHQPPPFSSLNQQQSS